MGKKNTTYYYDPYALLGYETYITSGISKWGNSITCTKVSDPDDAMGIICTTTDMYVDEENNPVLAFTNIEMNLSSRHITSWTISICTSYFSGLSSSEKSILIAHEIGHAYGLAHVTNSNNLMYPTISANMSVTSADRIGMNVMTHNHTHGNYTYTKLSSMRHIQTCSSCGGYTQNVCAVTASWHSGETHYYEYDCPCGNYDLVSVPCSGNCIDIMEHDDLVTE